MFLQECKHIKKEKEVIRYNTDNIKTTSDDSDAEISDSQEIQNPFQKIQKIYKLSTITTLGLKKCEKELLKGYLMHCHIFPISLRPNRCV